MVFVAKNSSSSVAYLHHLSRGVAHACEVLVVGTKTLSALGIYDTLDYESFLAFIICFNSNCFDLLQADLSMDGFAPSTRARVLGSLWADASVVAYSLPISSMCNVNLTTTTREVLDMCSMFCD